MNRGWAAGKAIVTMATIAVAIILLMTPSVQSFLWDTFSSPFRPKYPEEATFTLERTITIDPNGGTINRFTIDMPEPMNLIENDRRLQVVHSVTYSVDVVREVRYGHDWMVWTSDLPFSDRRTITATYEVTSRTVTWDIDAAASGSVSDIPAEIVDRYIHDQWVMTPGHPDIVARSQAIVGDEVNVYTILKSIYDWMRDNVEYSTQTFSSGPQDAVKTLELGAGDCDDQAALFCSLARAAGVPAWLQLGALYDGSRRAWGGHAWLQAYVPLNEGGGENVVIDPVNGEVMVWRPNRLVEYTDDADPEHLLDYYSIYNASVNRGTNTVLYDDYVGLTYEESGRMISLDVMMAADIMTNDRFLAPSRT
ncbi:MAG TPA: transglutaminase domain-containing protein [Methanomassiliicoccaceae archaeon]|nr:transglutaminase domain-containing protein [Methanomassiliicoccaceae archaeon]